MDGPSWQPSHNLRHTPSFASDRPSFRTAHSGAGTALPGLSWEPDHKRGFGSVSELELVERSEPKLTRTDTTQTITPAPTQDPRDPLNLPQTRKLLAVGFLCFFGAMAAAAELILGAMLPIFVLQYAHIDPKIIVSFEHLKFAPGTNPLRFIADLHPPGGIEKVYLLGSLPVLMIGLSNLVMVPLAAAVGRRPVILGCGILAISGCVWSGHSQSLDSHLAARCLQAIGAGTVESLIPFIISDLTFTHQRNTWMSFGFATQGLIIVGLGFASPYVIIDLSWRWLYFITAIGAGVFLIGVIIFLPETKWSRTVPELKGIPRDERHFLKAPRTWRNSVALFNGPKEWGLGLRVLTDALRTLFYPQILFITLVNGIMIGATFAAGYTAAEPLLVQPWAWPFFHLTLCLIPILLASLGVVLITGRVGDAVSNWGARQRKNQERCPEDQLLNLILPTVCGIVGCFLFGISAADQVKYSWAVYLTGLGFMAFGFLGTNTVGAVYVLELYPEMAGSALLNIASIRYIIAFIMSFRIADWVVGYGYLISFLIFAIPMAVTAMLLPFLWYYGPVWRVKFPARVTAEM